MCMIELNSKIQFILFDPSSTRLVSHPSTFAATLRAPKTSCVNKRTKSLSMYKIICYPKCYRLVLSQQPLVYPTSKKQAWDLPHSSLYYSSITVYLCNNTFAIPHIWMLPCGRIGRYLPVSKLRSNRGL